MVLTLCWWTINVFVAWVCYCLLNYYNFIWQGAGWKIVSCFEGRFPDRMKQLPLDRHFDINNVKRVSIGLLVQWYLFALLLCCFFSLLFGGVTTLTDPFWLWSDCVRSWWLSALSYFPWKGIKIINQRCSGARKRTISSLCWWGICIMKLNLYILPHVLCFFCLFSYFHLVRQSGLNLGM